MTQVTDIKMNTFQSGSKAFLVGCTPPEIYERLGRALLAIPGIILGEKKKIWKAYHQDESCLHDLAEMYGLTTNEIRSIYQDRQDRIAIERERERDQNRGWEDYLDGELEIRKQKLESETSV